MPPGAPASPQSRHGYFDIRQTSLHRARASTSGYRGVCCRTKPTVVTGGSLLSEPSAWLVTLWIDGKNKNLGCYSTAVHPFPFKTSRTHTKGFLSVF